MGKTPELLQPKSNPWDEGFTQMLRLLSEQQTGNYGQEGLAVLDETSPIVEQPFVERPREEASQ